MSEEWKPDKFDYADLAEHYRLAREEIKRLQGEYAALAAEVPKVATMFTCTDPTCPCGGAPVIEFEEAHIAEAELPAFAKVLREAKDGD